jgi:hypothetical protein
MLVFNYREMWTESFSEPAVCYVSTDIDKKITGRYQDSDSEYVSALIPTSTGTFSPEEIHRDSLWDTEEQALEGIKIGNAERLEYEKRKAEILEGDIFFFDCVKEYIESHFPDYIFEADEDNHFLREVKEVYSVRHKDNEEWNSEVITMIKKKKMETEEV